MKRRMQVAAVACALALAGTLAGPAGAANAAPVTRVNAAAAAVVPWRTFTGIESNWYCSGTENYPDYYEQACTIVSGVAYQGALIFVAKASNLYTVSVGSRKNRYLDAGYTICQGQVTAGTRVLCLGPTNPGDRGDYVQGQAYDPDLRELLGKTRTL